MKLVIINIKIIINQKISSPAARKVSVSNNQVKKTTYRMKNLTHNEKNIR